MAKSSVRFKRVAEAFDDMARGRMYETSGSEHMAENTMNLSDLVDSFIENECEGDCNKRDCDVEIDRDLDECDNVTELKESLSSLFVCDEENHDVNRNLVTEIEEAYRLSGINNSCKDFKRRLMTMLREKGFNAGLCKSKWDKNHNIPSGSYEYIDIIISNTRHIIEVNLANQFDIARPTKSYSSLLQIFPHVFIGKIEDFKRIVRLMCNAIKSSMKSSDMALPPWRRYGYMHAKWFGLFKRTINELPIKEGSDLDNNMSKRRSIGFVPVPANSYHCRGDFATNVGIRMGQLAMEMNGNNILL